MDAGNKPARIVIGALIIKHKMILSDEDTISIIQENPYVQYMLDLSEFTSKPVFDPSLFVRIRMRLQVEDFKQFTELLMRGKRTDSQYNSDTDTSSHPFFYSIVVRLYQQKDCCMRIMRFSHISQMHLFSDPQIAIAIDTIKHEKNKQQGFRP